MISKSGLFAVLFTAVIMSSCVSAEQAFRGPQEDLTASNNSRRTYNIKDSRKKRLPLHAQDVHRPYKISVYVIHGYRRVYDQKGRMLINPETNKKSKFTGGRLGGHVGLQIAEPYVHHFMPVGWFYPYTKGDLCRDSLYRFEKEWLHDKPFTRYVFYVSKEKYKNLKSVLKEARENEPNYSLFGSRCASVICRYLEDAGIIEDVGIFKNIARTYSPVGTRKYFEKTADNADFYAGPSDVNFR